MQQTVHRDCCAGQETGSWSSWWEMVSKLVEVEEDEDGERSSDHCGSPPVANTLNLTLYKGLSPENEPKTTQSLLRPTLDHHIKV